MHSVTGRCQGGEETGAVAAQEFPKVPLRVFFFWGKSSCSILRLPPYKEGPDLSHRPPLQLGGACPGQDHKRPNFQLSSASACGLPGFSLVLIPLPATSSSQVSLSVAQVLFGRGGSINSALSQESYSRPVRDGLRTAAALVPVLVPGNFLS